MSNANSNYKRKPEVKEDLVNPGIYKKTNLQIFTAAILFFLFFVSSPQLTAQETETHKMGQKQVIILQPGDIDWKPGPPSFEEGAEFSVLEGNPGKEGFFNLQIKMPDGFRISPHWHPRVERVTVISGTFRLGHGEVFDKAAADPLEAGSYFSLPPEMVHFAVTEGETVIQLTTIGPWEIHYVNPEDDPRKRQ